MSTQHLRILSIGAHPADVFDQCGGTMVHSPVPGDLQEVLRRCFRGERRKVVA